MNPSYKWKENDIIIPIFIVWYALKTQQYLQYSMYIFLFSGVWDLGRVLILVLYIMDYFYFKNKPNLKDEFTVLIESITLIVINVCISFCKTQM